MPINLEDMTVIKSAIFAEADNKYVKVEDCTEHKIKVNKKFADDDKRIEIIAHDFGVIKKLMWLIATSGIGSLVVAFFDLVRGL